MILRARECPRYYVLHHEMVINKIIIEIYICSYRGTGLCVTATLCRGLRGVKTILTTQTRHTAELYTSTTLPCTLKYIALQFGLATNISIDIEDNKQMEKNHRYIIIIKCWKTLLYVT